MCVEDGFVYTMGNNMNGRLGLGEKSLTHSPVPCLVEGLLSHRMNKVSCGWAHSASVTQNGEVFTWGLGEFGALGHGDLYTRYEPHMVEILVQKDIFIRDLDAGTRHTAFISTSGELFACGSGDAGQLGTGTRDKELVPVRVNTQEKVAHVSCGIFHTCFVTRIYIIYIYIYIECGDLFSMGGNTFGQLGLGHKKSIVSPCKVEGFPHSTRISNVACGHHSACVSEDGELFIWGTGVFGEYIIPHRVVELANPIRSIDIGGCFGSALDIKGQLWTWGSNTSGELGVGDYDPRILPFPIHKLHKKVVIGMSCGASYAMALGPIHKTDQPTERLASPTPSIYIYIYI